MAKEVAKAPKIERAEDGTFPKGVSGNPAGRPKGSKNQITLLRQSLELQLREQAAPDMGAVLDKAVELALEGDARMIKLLLEMHMSKSIPESKELKEKVSININAGEAPKVVNQPIIEAEEADFEEITDG